MGLNGKQALGVLTAAFRVQAMPSETTTLYALKLGEIASALLEKTVAAVIDRCKFFPSIAEIREVAAELAGVPDGHLGPEEAWALVASLGEADTVVWTDEIAHAYGVAASVLPDRVGARMAFLEVYRKKLADARRMGSAASWWASLGWDVSKRASPVIEAVALGRLPQWTATGMLPPRAWPAEWQRTLAGDVESPRALSAP